MLWGREENQDRASCYLEICGNQRRETPPKAFKSCRVKAKNWDPVTVISFTPVGRHCCRILWRHRYVWYGLQPRLWHLVVDSLTHKLRTTVFIWCEAIASSESSGQSCCFKCSAIIASSLYSKCYTVIHRSRMNVTIWDLTPMCPGAVGQRIRRCGPAGPGRRSRILDSVTPWVSAHGVVHSWSTWSGVHTSSLGGAGNTKLDVPHTTSVGYFL